ncbi:hypothetical protein N656DRAFT_433489 [Canariomyces notabilis]|uniref:Uncharacterized protein n=1 Tax=Canariomyces notabilis TaxID=2074819 RepID=A0AAN6QE52_9PEZI|nr:hypothetical protein N656DRAFT_433489 [Canariomyces arenarius]
MSEFCSCSHEHHPTVSVSNSPYLPKTFEFESPDEPSRDSSFLTFLQPHVGTHDQEHVIQTLHNESVLGARWFRNVCDSSPHGSESLFLASGGLMVHSGHPAQCPQAWDVQVSSLATQQPSTPTAQTLARFGRLFQVTPFLDEHRGGGKGLGNTRFTNAPCI